MSADENELVLVISMYLDREWDPIGIYSDGDFAEPEPGTEYAHYAAHVLGMLRRGEAASAISHYLTQQATQAMGVGPGATKTVAQKLHSWWSAGHTRPSE